MFTPPMPLNRRCGAGWCRSRQARTCEALLQGDEARSWMSTWLKVSKSRSRQSRNRQSRGWQSRGWQSRLKQLRGLPNAVWSGRVSGRIVISQSILVDDGTANRSTIVNAQQAEPTSAPGHRQVCKHDALATPGK